VVTSHDCTGHPIEKPSRTGLDGISLHVIIDLSKRLFSERLIAQQKTHGSIDTFNKLIS